MRILTAAAAALLGSLLLAGTAIADPTAAPSASATPSPTPAPSPSPAVALHAVLSESLAFTSGVNRVGSFDSSNGMDRSERANVSNAFVILTKTSGTLQFGLQGGAYSIPTLGVAGNKTIQTGANTDLYGPLPLGFAAYVPNGNFSIATGVLATLTGQESTFTYQDWNVQRGAVWNVENAVSRGFRASFTSGKAVATLGADDGFYSGKYGAEEASLTYAPDSNDSWLLVFLDPNPRTPGNPTTSVANKALYNLVLSHTAGKVQVVPYILYAASPATAALGYTNAEHAFGAAILANVSISPTFSTAFRVETLHNSSMAGDTSPNADLIGYGPGSGINTWTITPAWQLGHGAFFRFDVSQSHVTQSAPGLAFGSGGNSHDQSRVMLEIGTQL
jgi:hypothetical protein